MTNKIVIALVTCVIISAIGGFGAPMFCENSKNDKCAQNWKDAATGSLAASGALGTLLATLAGVETNRDP